MISIHELCFDYDKYVDYQVKSLKLLKVNDLETCLKILLVKNNKKVNASININEEDLFKTIVLLKKINNKDDKWKQAASYIRNELTKIKFNETLDRKENVRKK